MGGPSRGRLWVGTSGWTYPHWRRVFYPEGVNSADYLRFYASRFRTTEVNYSFYHVPRTETYRRWAEQAAEPFLFSVKVNRAITHVRRLQNVEELWTEFRRGALELGTRLGVFLFQFPPSFQLRTDLLTGFLAQARALGSVERMAFEFRHESWFVPEVYGALGSFGACMVIADSARYPCASLEPSGPFVYVRFHGPKELFASSYSEAELSKWANLIRSWLKAGQDVYAYFNNDAAGAAVSNGVRLLDLA